LLIKKYNLNLKNMKKLFLICLTAIFCLQFANAQTTITGKVTSKKDKTPIVGAIITAKGNTTVTATSGADGSYSIVVPAGAKVLEANFAGMKKNTQGIGKKKAVNFEMMPVPGKKGSDTGKRTEKKEGKKEDKKK
jgi:TonB-dependent starch-binding outer membrane protein SusC